MKLKKLASLGICLLALLSSCGGKGNNISPTPPKPTPTPSPNPGTSPTPVPDGGEEVVAIKLTLKEGETTFTLAGLGGSNVTIEGIQGATPANWTYPLSSAPTTNELTASKAGGTVLIKGDVTLLAIAKGKFANISLKRVPASLTSFVCYGSTVDAIDLSGATNLQNLFLGVSARTDGRGYGFDEVKTLDLSKLTKLQRLWMHAICRGTGDRISYPSSLSHLTQLFLSETDANNLAPLTTALVPSLETFRAYGVSTLKGGFNFANHTKLRTIVNSRSHVRGSIDLSNISTLQSANIFESSLPENIVINISNSAITGNALNALLENIASHSAPSQGTVRATSITLSQEQKDRLTSKGWKVEQ